MEGFVTTEFTSGYREEIAYDVAPDRWNTVYRILYPDYTDNEKRLYEPGLINISNRTTETTVSIEVMLNIVLYELRMRQIGDHPTRRNDYAICAVVDALNQLTKGVE